VGAQRGPATRWISLLAAPGRRLVLVDPRVEDSPVHHLGLLLGRGPLGRRVALGGVLGGSASDHDAGLRGRRQAALEVGGGMFSGFGAVKMERRIGRFTRRGRSMKEARELLWDVALPALLQQSAGGGG